MNPAATWAASDVQLGIKYTVTGTSKDMYNNALANSPFAGVVQGLYEARNAMTVPTATNPAAITLNADNVTTADVKVTFADGKGFGVVEGVTRVALINENTDAAGLELTEGVLSEGADCNFVRPATGTSSTLTFPKDGTFVQSLVKGTNTLKVTLTNGVTLDVTITAK